MSMVVSDIGALELVGVAGAAYMYGIAVANFDWIGCIPAMIVGAFIFIPYYWRAGVFTIPDFLGRRYNSVIQVLTALMWGCFMMFMLGVFFYTAALTMELLCGWDIYFSILLVAVVVGVYTLIGGLSAVVYTDAVQFIILFIGSIIILIISLMNVGGWDGLAGKILSMGDQYEHHLSLLAPADSATPYGWTGIFFGLTLVLSPAYWLGNQAVVQRNLAARSEYEAKKSVLCGAFLKLFIPVLLVGPGLAGIALYPGLERGDDIYPTLIHDLLPPGLTGLLFAAFLAALMSSVDSYLNSAATLWTKDIYQNFFHPDDKERHYLVVGRICTAIFILMGILLAPLTEKFPSIFGYMQTMLSIFQGPLLALIVLGLLWKRATGRGAVIGLLLGVCTSSLLFWLKELIFSSPEPFLFIAWWAFLISLTTTIIFSLCTKPEPAEKIAGLTYQRYDTE